MGKETSDFDGWLRIVKAATRDLKLINSLNAIALLARKDFGVRLWFVEILGRRWSYIAGEMPEQPPQSNIQRIELENNIGLVSDSWERLSEGDRSKLVEFLNHCIADKVGCNRKMKMQSVLQRTWIEQGERS